MFNPTNTLTKSNSQQQQVKKDDFSHYVNLDANLIDSQVEEIDKLNEKQKLLLNKIKQLQVDIESLNGEREIFIKKIDFL
jgi:hypothetical protein